MAGAYQVVVGHNVCGDVVTHRPPSHQALVGGKRRLQGAPLHTRLYQRCVAPEVWGEPGHLHGPEVVLSLRPQAPPAAATQHHVAHLR